MAKFTSSTYSMKLSSVSSKLHFIKVPTSRPPRRMQWLVDISQKMSHPLQRIRARQVCPTLDTLIPTNHSCHALPQYSCLVRNRTDDTSTLRTVFLIVQRTPIRGPIMRVDPVPLVREAAFDRVGVCVSPCGGPTNGSIILWFEEVGEECGGTGRQEGLRHEADLVVH